MMLCFSSIYTSSIIRMIPLGCNIFGLSTARTKYHTTPEKWALFGGKM
jgi:hypothetical protein